MSEAIRKEVDTNYDFFQRNLSALLDRHRGQYALIRSAEISDFFDNPGDAYRAGLARFSDHIFSIQEVTDEPVDLGMFSIEVL